MDDFNKARGPEQQPEPLQAPPAYQQGPPPQQDTAKKIKDERMWAMFCHLAAFSGYIGVPLGSVVGPLVIWLIKRDTSAFVDDQGKQSLNFHISLVLYAILCIPLVFVLIGFVLLFVLWILDVVCTITGAVKANKGEAYRYPLAIPFIR